ncbi:hypothetical protein D3C73_1511930 [compost metagenome]
MARAREDLPEALGPMIARTSPLARLMVTPLTAGLCIPGGMITRRSMPSAPVGGGSGMRSAALGNSVSNRFNRS